MARKTVHGAQLRKICSLILLVCIFFSIFPHDHSCSSNHCPLCALRDLLDEFFVAAVFWGLLPIFCSLLSKACDTVSSTCGQTLVQQKVKLSN